MPRDSVKRPLDERLLAKGFGKLRARVQAAPKGAVCPEVARMLREIEEHTRADWRDTDSDAKLLRKCLDFMKASGGHMPRDTVTRSREERHLANSCGKVLARLNAAPKGAVRPEVARMLREIEEHTAPTEDSDAKLLTKYLDFLKASGGHIPRDTVCLLYTSPSPRDS